MCILYTLNCNTKTEMIQHVDGHEKGLNCTEEVHQTIQ